MSKKIMILAVMALVGLSACGPRVQPAGSAHGDAPNVSSGSPHARTPTAGGLH